MKVRQGFVSNSSSSSFIVAFPKDFEITSKNVRQYLFSDREYVSAYGDAYGTDHVADQVTRDLRAQEPNREEALCEALEGHDPNGPDINDFRVKRKDGPGSTYDWVAYNKAREEHTKKVIEKFKAEYAGMNLYVFEYSDNDGDFYCTMEHGDIFGAVPSITISNH